MYYFITHDLLVIIVIMSFFFVLFLLYSRSFPVIAQAEVKTILKSSGDNFKREREKEGHNHDNH